MLPRKRAAENRPPRKPDPSEQAAANIFRMRITATDSVIAEFHLDMDGGFSAGQHLG